jgi:hypothetical protein
VLPPEQRREDRQVLRLQFVIAGGEDVGESAAVDEDGGLRFAHDQPRAVLDLVVVTLEAMHHRVARRIEPFDDVDRFALELIQPTHIARPGGGMKGDYA